MLTGDQGDTHSQKLTGAICTVPTGLGYGLLAMGALWHRIPLSFEIRKCPPSSLQGVLGVPHHSSGVSGEDDTVDFEHAVVWRVWDSQIAPLECGTEAFRFRTEVDSVAVVVTVHANDSRTTHSAVAGIALDRTILEAKL